MGLSQNLGSLYAPVTLTGGVVSLSSKSTKQGPPLTVWKALGLFCFEGEINYSYDDLGTGAVSSNPWPVPFRSSLGTTAYSPLRVWSVTIQPACQGPGCVCKWGERLRHTHICTAGDWLWPVCIQVHAPYRVEGDTNNLWVCSANCLACHRPSGKPKQSRQEAGLIHMVSCRHILT